MKLGDEVHYFEIEMFSARTTCDLAKCTGPDAFVVFYPGTVGFKYQVNSDPSCTKSQSYHSASECKWGR